MFKYSLVGSLHLATPLGIFTSLFWEQYSSSFIGIFYSAVLCSKAAHLVLRTLLGKAILQLNPAGKKAPMLKAETEK